MTPEHSGGDIVRKVWMRIAQVEESTVIGETPQRFPATILAPFMIHEALPSHTETAFGSHPCCVVSVTYVWTHCFHGANEGSNPSGDANQFNNFRTLS